MYSLRTWADTMVSTRSIDSVAHRRGEGRETHKVARVVAALGGIPICFGHLEGFSAGRSGLVETASGVKTSMLDAVLWSRPGGGRAGAGLGSRQEKATAWCRGSAKRSDAWTQRRGRAGVRVDWQSARLLQRRRGLSQPPRGCARRREKQRVWCGIPGQLGPFVGRQKCEESGREDGTIDSVGLDPRQMNGRHAHSSGWHQGPFFPEPRSKSRARTTTRSNLMAIEAARRRPVGWKADRQAGGGALCCAVL